MARVKQTHLVLVAILVATSAFTPCTRSRSNEASLRRLPTFNRYLVYSTKEEGSVDPNEGPVPTGGEKVADSFLDFKISRGGL